MKPLLTFLTLFVMLGGVASAEEKKWEINKSKDGSSVMMSINGEITHGDTLNLLLKKFKGKCDTVHHTFVFYSESKNPKIKNLEGKLIPINIKGIR